MTELRQREPRRRNPAYLAWVRRQACACGCAQPAPCDAAHIRSGSLRHGKDHTGLSEKPSDCWAVPLKRADHMRQHDYGHELGWWVAHRKDPFRLALQYNARYTRETGLDPTVNTVRKRPAEAVQRAAEPKVRKPRRQPKRAPRKPAAKARPIAKRPGSWPKGRKIKSRGFK